VRSGVDLEVGTTTVDGQLTVGATQTEVRVTAEAPLLQTESAEQSTTLQAQVMQELPNVNQSWANFTKLLPGAAGRGTGVAVNGNLPYYNNFLADGSNVMLPHSANFDQMVFEDVAEVQMNTSTFSAQYGVGGAVFNQISKGGTNQWHGSAYEYFQNDDLNARNFFSASVPFERFDISAVASAVRSSRTNSSFSLTSTRPSTIRRMRTSTPSLPPPCALGTSPI